MTTEYRIDREDIRGVGPTVRDHLDATGIESVAALHLLRRRGGRSWRQLEERGVGSDTLEHLQAVGQAVKGSTHASVKAKHLTADCAADTPATMRVRLDTDANAAADANGPDASLAAFTDEATADEAATDEATCDPPATDALDEALTAIREGYDDDERGMDAWMDFSSDIADYLEATDRDDIARDFHQPAVQHAVVRYPLPAEQVADEDTLDPTHLQALTDFATAECQ